MAENDSKTVDASTDDLNDFDDLFNGRVTETPKEEPTEEVDEPEALEAEEEIDADDDTAEEDDDSSATEQEETEEEPSAAPKKKNTVQERIDELTKARREAEREADRWKAIAEERERGQSKKTETESTETEPETELKAPDKTDKDKYPLGDLDPQYAADMIDYKLELRIAQLDKERETSEQKRAQQAREEALQAEWTGKLAAAEETYEDFRETVASLESAFVGVDPQHGQFIAETVMGMENGTDVLYHLAKNPDIVGELVRANPVNAALALGRLEASFAEPVAAPKPKVKSTKAPPPPKVNKGNATSLSVKPDTDDLDAFENVFFDKK